MDSEDRSRESLARARHLLQLDRPQQAIPLLTDALRDAPDDPEALAVLACAYLQCNDYIQALGWAERAAVEDPFEEYPHRLRAFALLALGRKPEALTAAQEAVRLDPHESAALWVLSQVYGQTKRWKEALAIGEELTELYPEDPDSHQARAEALLGLRRWQEAEQAARDGLGVAPDSAGLHISLARALWAQKRRPESLQAYREGVVSDLGNPFAINALAEQVGGYLVPAWLALPWYLWMCLTSFFCWAAHHILGWWSWWGLLWSLVVLVWNTMYLLDTDHWILRYRRRQYFTIPEEVRRHLWLANAFSPNLLVTGIVVLLGLVTAVTLIVFTFFPRLVPALPEWPVFAFCYLVGLFFSVFASMSRSGKHMEEIKFLKPLELTEPAPAAPDAPTPDWLRHARPRFEDFDLSQDLPTPPLLRVEDLELE